MNKEKYLRRIGVTAAARPIREPTPENLARLQTQHLRHVPFENLDIHRRVPIRLDTERFYRKIVENKRGGFCYELNGLFERLLRRLGFRTKIISARVADGRGGFGPEYDHLAILVRFGEEEYLADVGFGDFAAAPLRLVADTGQEDAVGRFRICERDDGYFEVSRQKTDDAGGGVWKSEYLFRPAEHDLAEFTGMCRFHQTSPASHFTSGRVCSLLTETGRKTLTDKKYIVTDRSAGEKTESGIGSEKEFSAILEKEFGIRL